MQRRHVLAMTPCLLVSPVGLAQRSELPPDARGLLQTVLVPDVLASCLPEVTLQGAEFDPRQPGAPAAERAGPGRIVLAFDSSGSMAGRLGQVTKMAAAQTAAVRFLEGLPPGVEAGLLAFGHRGNARQDGRAASCGAAEVLVEPGTDRRALREAVSALRPVGWTPLASAMQAASRLFRPSAQAGEQTLMVISDGVETCGGDPVSVARSLHGGALRVVVDIIGFDIAQAERQALTRVAEAGGGRFRNVENANEAEDALRRTRDQMSETLRGSRNQITATTSTSRNTIAATQGSSRAQICVTQAMNRENNGLSQAIGRSRGTLPAAVVEEAQRLLAQRHGTLRQGVEEYGAALREANAARARDIRARLDEAMR